MKLVKQAGVILAALLMTLSVTITCFASEDTPYSAVLAMTRKPGQHREYMAYGAAGGAVAGGAYGLFKNQTSLVEIKDDKISVDVPLIMPDVQEKGTRGTDFTIIAKLISGKF